MFALALCLIASSACHVGDLFTGPAATSDPPVNGRLQSTSGDIQSDSVAATLASPYTVRLVDASGDPLSGVAVDWSVVEGGGSVSPVGVTTDSDGIARTTHTLGTETGWQRVRASVAGATDSPVEFASFATHASPHSLGYEINASDVAMGQPIAPAIRVVLRDRFGNVTDGQAGSAVIELVEGKGNPLASLSGTLTVSIANGRAVFDDVRVSLVGAGYQLRVRGAGLAAGSADFDVVLVP